MAELSLHPFETAFRFSLGPAALAFVALYVPTAPPALVGFLAGLLVPLIHGGLAWLQGPGAAAVGAYLPETLIYTLLGLLLSVLQVQRWTERPLELTALLAGADGAANLVEILLRGEPAPLLVTLPVAGLVAVARAVVAEGAFYVLQEGARTRQWAEERRRHAEQLLFLSNLQTEAFFLQKSSREMEQVMAKAHRLYRDLAGAPEQPFALEIATEIHEVKKDAQRTLSALFRLLEMPRIAPTQTLAQVVDLVLDANQTYAVTLGRQVSLQADLAVDFLTPRFGRWVSILNNLVSNAVEALDQAGSVTITARRSGDLFVVQVRDTGPGIPPEEWDLIFSPGFTTKLNPVTGNFSSGIGLTHVAGLVQAMEGQIRIAQSGPGGTIFDLQVPWANLEIVAEEE